MQGGSNHENGSRTVEPQNSSSDSKESQSTSNLQHLGNDGLLKRPVSTGKIAAEKFIFTKAAYVPIDTVGRNRKQHVLHSSKGAVATVSDVQVSESLVQETCNKHLDQTTSNVSTQPVSDIENDTSEIHQDVITRDNAVHETVDKRMGHALNSHSENPDAPSRPKASVIHETDPTLSTESDQGINHCEASEVDEVNEARSSSREATVSTIICSRENPDPHNGPSLRQSRESSASTEHRIQKSRKHTKRASPHSRNGQHLPLTSAADLSYDDIAHALVQREKQAQSDKSKLMDTVRKLSIELDKQQEENERLEQARQNLRTELQSMTAAQVQLDKYRKRLESIQRGLKGWGGDLTTMRRMGATVNDSIGEIKASIQENKASATQMRSTLSQLEQKLTVVSNHREDLRSEVARNRDLREQLASQWSRRETAEHELNERRAELTEVRNSRVNLEGRLERATNKFGDIEKALHHQHGYLEDKFTSHNKAAQEWQMQQQESIEATNKSMLELRRKVSEQDIRSNLEDARNEISGRVDEMRKSCEER